MTTTSIQALLDSMLIERTKLYAARRTVTRLCRDISKLREDAEAPCSAKRLARIHRLETRHWAMGRMIDTLDDTLKVLRYMDSLGREGDTR